ncbi:MAG: hypothetical protein AB7N65_12435 [Vicinamibacterales bacterium]
MPVVVVFSRETSTAEFLKRALDSAGFAAFTAPAVLAELDGFVHAIHPHAVVVDMTLATEALWQELLRVRGRPTWDDDVPMVLTTAEESGLKRWMTGPLAGASPVVELLTHADDLRKLRTAVDSAVHGRRTASGIGRPPPS